MAHRFRQACLSFGAVKVDHHHHIFQRDASARRRDEGRVEGIADNYRRLCGLDPPARCDHDGCMRRKVRVFEVHLVFECYRGPGELS